MPEESLSTRQLDIAHAALRLIDEVGPLGMTTSALAAEVGVTTGALFRHFKSKEEILSTCVHLLTAHMREAMMAKEAEATALERLRGRLLRMAKTSGEIPGCTSMMFSTQLANVLPKEALMRIMTSISAGRERMLGTLREGQEAGEIRTDLSPEELAPVVMATMRHVIFLSRSSLAQQLHFLPSSEQVVDTLIALLRRPSP